MAMKKCFNELYYKHREHNQEIGKLPPNWGRDLDEDDYFENPQNYKFVDHPADTQVDYNSIIDFLEEEHLRRDVFTISHKVDGRQYSFPVSDNSASYDRGVVEDLGRMFGPLPKNKSDSNELSYVLVSDEPAKRKKEQRGPRKRGPRKKREAELQASSSLVKMDSQSEEFVNESANYHEPLKYNK